MTKLPWKTVWITGGSTGIGAALALRLADNGVNVAATARSQDALESLSNRHPNIQAYPADVCNRSELAAVAENVRRDLGDIDLTIFNAGTWAPLTITEFDCDIYKRIMDVNYQGVIRGLDVILPDYLSRGAGQIAIVASVAGYRGLPHAAAYGASKAALINLSESLYPELKARGVKLSLINPGFVDTPMTSENDFPMPFKISVKQAAEHIVTGLQNDKFEIAFPWKMVALLKFMRLLPYKLFFRLAPKPRK